MTDAATQPEPSPGTHDAAHDAAAHDEHDHPGAMTYVLVALVLTVLTALEVAVFYIPALEVAIVPILLTLTTGKFVLVVMFYMHLKMDSKIFTWVFVAPLVLAMFLVVALVVLFRVLPAYS